MPPSLHSKFLAGLITAILAVTLNLGFSSAFAQTGVAPLPGEIAALGDKACKNARAEDPTGRGSKPGSRNGPQCTNQAGHEGKDRPGASINALSSEPRLVDSNGMPAAGWWALGLAQPNPGAVFVPEITAASRWANDSAMGYARYGHTATLLPSNQVLVAGGGSARSNAGFDPLASAELYDPATAQWTPAAAMQTARLLHTATRLPNGQVLVAGGIDTHFSPMASAELFDPATGKWTVLDSMASARAGHTATLLESGDVLVSGGYGGGPGGVTASAERFSLADMTWAPAAAMQAPRWLHATALLPSGQVLVTGGNTGGADTLSGAELYDPGKNQWASAGQMARPREQHTATTLLTGKVLVAGGDTTRNDPAGERSGSAELYDPESGWGGVSEMARSRFAPTATLLPTGQVLLAGGHSGEYPGWIGPVYATGVPCGDSELFDPATQAWGAPESFPQYDQGLYWHTATLLRNGKVLLAGGGSADPDILIGTMAYLGVRALALNVGAAAIDDDALFSFSNPRRPMAYVGGGLPLSLGPTGPGGNWTLFAGNDFPAQESFFASAPLVVSDLGNYTVSLSVTHSNGATAKLSLENGQFVEDRTGHSSAAQFTVRFRYFPDGSAVTDDSLQEGEVAVFEKPQYQGWAAIFAADQSDFASLGGNLFTFGPIGSVKLGNNTGLLAYSGTGFQGTVNTVKIDNPALNFTAGSFKPTPLVKILQAGGDCQRCRMEKVDLKAFDLSGKDLTQADLVGADLTGATLIKSTLQGAYLHGATLTNANLTGANLSGAFFGPIPEKFLKSASFSGAYLKNANLSSADLTGATFDYSNFYGSTATGPGTTCAILAGGFTDNCASANGATLTLANFEGAFLYGVDFGGAKLGGTKFSQAILIGANFTNAKATNPQGSHTDFEGAYLQGATLPASLSAADFYHALFDFAKGGNTVTLRLDGTHTFFAGYWGGVGEQACVQMSYEQSLAVPGTDSSLTCPDNSSASNNNPPGCGTPGGRNLAPAHWNASPWTIGASNPAGWYKDKASYDNAATAGCAKDALWWAGRPPPAMTRPDLPLNH